MSFKLRDFLLPLILACGLTFVFLRFVGERGAGTRADQLASGRRHVTTDEFQHAINREIDFIDSEKQEENLTVVETDYGRVTFTNVGGALQKLEFKHDVSPEHDWITTIDAKSNEDKSFLIALEGPSPLYYKQDSYFDGPDKAQVSYSVQFDKGTITKRFSIYKRINKIELLVEAEPKSVSAPLRMRLFYPAPFIQELSKNQVNGVFIDDINSSSVQKKPSNLLMNSMWKRPSLFGAEDKYFLNMMYKDENIFGHRAFYRESPDGLLTAVLEAYPLKEKKDYFLSFYFGPKKMFAMSAVDPMLEKTLDYGFLAPVSKLLLKILNFFYGYVHNYGWAILFLTLLLKLLMAPFTFRAEGDDEKRKEYQKKMKQIDEMYKGDSERLNAAKAALFKEHGIPGMGGCIPILLQFPIFIALNRLLYY